MFAQLFRLSIEISKMFDSMIYDEASKFRSLTQFVCEETKGTYQLHGNGCRNRRLFNVVSNTKEDINSLLPNFEDTGHLLWLLIPTCFGSGRECRRKVFLTMQLTLKA